MAEKQIEIKVTQADIDRAKVKNSSRCVVATAIHRSIPGSSRVSVDVQTIRFSTPDGERHVYLTPYGVAGYVVAFDAGDEIHPFNFRLRSDQLVKARRRTRTEAGKHRARTRENEKNAAQQLEMATEEFAALADRSPDLPPPTPQEVKAARAKIRQAKEKVINTKQERANVMAAYEGQKEMDNGDPSMPKAAPKVFKRAERAYGMRQLRVNQQA